MLPQVSGAGAQAGVPLPRELSLYSPALNLRSDHSQTRLTEALQTPKALQIPACSSLQAGGLAYGTPSLLVLAPWAWRAVRRRRPGPGQEEAGHPPSKALGGCGGCPGNGQEDLGSRPALSWVGPVPRGQTLLSGCCLSSYKLKAFYALRPCASLNEASLLRLEADRSPGMRIPKREDRGRAGPW